MHKILVIDDKEEIRLKLQLLLQKEGYAVETVAGPAHAKILQRSTAFDLILVDLNDPFESRKGQESLGYLTEQFGATLDHLLIPMTAWPSGELMQQASVMGASNFIEKPIKPARVLQVIHQELEIHSLKAMNDKLTAELNKMRQHSQQLPMMTLEQAEVQLIQQAISASDNNVVKAAKLLGLTKSSLYRRLEKYGLSKPSQLSDDRSPLTQH